MNGKVAALVAVVDPVIRRFDGGQSWTELPAPGAILTLATHSERQDSVLAGIASGGVALSEDSGRSWESRSAGFRRAK